MKTKAKTIALFFLFCLGSWIKPQTAVAQVSVSFQVFYDELSPYGYWVNNPNYGYVWVPNVSPGFTPYATNGYWVYTTMGWTWVSDYAWGWAPFHYGRWYYDPMYGQIWIPGNEWGPGWVTWRSSPGYYGWAPMGPYGGGYVVTSNQWTFVGDNDFGRTNITNYYVNNSNNTTIINNSTVINNNTGPNKTEAEKRSGKIFTPVAIKENSKPGQKLIGNQLSIYKPVVQKNNASSSKAAPAKVTELKDIKTTGQKTGASPKQKTMPAGKQENKPVKQQQTETKQLPPFKKAEQNQDKKQNVPVQKTEEQQTFPAKQIEREQQQQPVPKQRMEEEKQPSQGSPFQKQEGQQQQQSNPPQNTGGEKQMQRNTQSPVQKQPQQQQGNQSRKAGKRN